MRVRSNCDVSLPIVDSYYYSSTRTLLVEYLRVRYSYLEVLPGIRTTQSSTSTRSAPQPQARTLSTSTVLVRE